MTHATESYNVTNSFIKLVVEPLLTLVTADPISVRLTDIIYFMLWRIGHIIFVKIFKT